MNGVTIFEPRPLTSEEVLRSIAQRMRRIEGTDVEVIELTDDGRVISSNQILGARQSTRQQPGVLLSRRRLISLAERIRRVRRVREEQEDEMAMYPTIVAIIPTFETEEDIDKAVESLLLQNRAIDRIVVIINGPGQSDTAFKKLKGLAAEFPNQLTVERPKVLNGLRENKESRGSKVGALNYAYRRYLEAGQFNFMLGFDADVEADHEMVHHLENDLLKNTKAAGVIARYSFKVPENQEGKSMSLVYNQRFEFTVTGIRHQLRNYTTNILGGQATLFRTEVLRQVAKGVSGNAPWNPQSLVEDADLTREAEKSGYSAATSSTARAWVGPMYNSNSWQKQRRKWQDGHLSDMIRDFHPMLDQRRWREQIAMGWNLLLRILLAVTLAVSVSLQVLSVSYFTLIWLIPVGLTVLQSLLVACKIPDRSLREIIRALLFIPGEVYYARTLSVWLDSVLLAIVNVRRDGWGNQAKAESATSSRLGFSVWLIVAMAVAVPMALMFVLSSFLSEAAMSYIVKAMWYTVATLTIGSVLAMVWFIFRMIVHWRRLSP